MLSLSDNNQTDIIEAFNSTSRYLDDLLNIDNPYFEQMVGQIYPIPANTPEIGNGFVLLIEVGKYILFNWVKYSLQYYK